MTWSSPCSCRGILSSLEPPEVLPLKRVAVFSEQLCSGLDDNVMSASAQLVFASIDESFADDAPLLPSGFRVISLDSKTVGWLPPFLIVTLVFSPLMLISIARGKITWLEVLPSVGYTDDEQDPGLGVNSGSRLCRPSAPEQRGRCEQGHPDDRIPVQLRAPPSGPCGSNGPPVREERRRICAEGGYGHRSTSRLAFGPQVAAWLPRGAHSCPLDLPELQVRAFIVFFMCLWRAKFKCLQVGWGFPFFCISFFPIRAINHFMVVCSLVSKSAVKVPHRSGAAKGGWPAGRRLPAEAHVAPPRRNHVLLLQVECGQLFLPSSQPLLIPRVAHFNPSMAFKFGAGAIARLHVCEPSWPGLARDDAGRPPGPHPGQGLRRGRPEDALRWVLQDHAAGGQDRSILPSLPLPGKSLELHRSTSRCGRQGLAYLPAGICMSSMGRPASYEQAVAWRVLNEDANHYLAFMFVNWSFVWALGSKTDCLVGSPSPLVPLFLRFYPSCWSRRCGPYELFLLISVCWTGPRDAVSLVAHSLMNVGPPLLCMVQGQAVLCWIFIWGTHQAQAGNLSMGHINF